MLAVHFGAGNIGRGFIGLLLSQSGYDVCFVDINSELIDAINQRIGYKVVFAAKTKDDIYVENVRGINSERDPEKVIEAIAQADLVTTAVGPNVLKFIADLVAKGIRKRITQNDKPLNVIACENVIGGSTILKESVYAKLSEDEKVKADQQVGFPNSAVDRIVPEQHNEDLLKVVVEPFYEWAVEETKILGDQPPVTGITYVANLTPYIERKLFTVNTGHIVAAYLGYYYKKNTIKEAMEHKEIRKVIEGALQETGALLVEKHGFDHEEHSKYIDKILTRFENPYISDEVTRVGRSPLRKLGKNDRLISPAIQIVTLLNKQPYNLILAIAAALLYDYEGDIEAAQIQETISNEGVEGTVVKYTGLTLESALVELITKKYYELKNRNY